MWTLLPLAGMGQNLIPNPGFEHFLECPEQMGALGEVATHWEAPTEGSTDFFHSCSARMGIPVNFNGRQAAAEGSGYAGMYLYAPGDYREYLEVGLSQPLIDGLEYEVGFSVSLAERSDYALQEFGLLLSDRPVRAPHKKVLGRRHWFAENGAKVYLETVGNAYYADTTAWIALKLRFTARGGERFLTIGNFDSNRRTRTRPTGHGSNKGAYYYLDGFYLRPMEAGYHTAVPEAEGPAYAVDSLQVFSSLLFRFDTAELSTAGQEELNRLYRRLSGEIGLHLELRGHTDNVGPSGYNQSLSERRCQAVAGYLEELGLEASRIRWQGFGASVPVADNTQATGRRKNRRVEFRLYYPDAAPE